MFQLTLLTIILTATPTESAPQPIALIELFTSEGCSSCPPADRLLDKLLTDAKKHNRPVIGLSYHVDYWNWLGWRDRFSDKAYSRRQEQYAAALKSQRIYTPQMIVNGRFEFVGSQPRLANAAIDHVLEQPADVNLKLAAAISDDKDKAPVRITWRLSAVPQDAVLVVALVQTRAQSDVKRGENAGRELTHVNIVRRFVTHAFVSKKTEGELALNLPPDLPPTDARVIAFIQHPQSMHILTAAETSVAITKRK